MEKRGVDEFRQLASKARSPAEVSAGLLAFEDLFVAKVLVAATGTVPKATIQTPVSRWNGVAPTLVATPTTQVRFGKVD